MIDQLVLVLPSNREIVVMVECWDHPFKLFLVFYYLLLILLHEIFVADHRVRCEKVGRRLLIGLPLLEGSEREVAVDRKEFNFMRKGVLL